MKLSQILASREQVTREALYHAFPAEKAKIQKVLKEAGAEWYPELVALVGEAAAVGILDLLNKEV